ncbi:MAG: hypothetical protein QW400_00160 [Candidatus Diapherotrites archaeon]
MNQKAQISLEFLIVLAVAIAAMCLILPSASRAYSKSIKAIDLANAKLFASELKSSIKLMEQLSEGSELELRCNPLQDWNFSIRPGLITLSVNGSDINVDTAFKVISSNSTLSLNKTSCFLLKRQKDAIFLKVQNC